MSTEILPENGQEVTKYTWRNGVKWKEATGWAFIDFSNSIYITIVISAVYSPFFTQYVAPGDISTTLWSIALLIPTILTILVIPIVGSIIDLTGHSLRWLGVTIVGFSVATMLLYVIKPNGGNSMIAGCIVVIVIGRLMFNINEGVGSSFLPNTVNTESYIGLVSGYGWAVGYIGGLIGLSIVTFGILGSETDANYAQTVQTGMLVTGIMSLITAVPIGICLWHTPSEPVLKKEKIISLGYFEYIVKHTERTFIQIYDTFKEMKKHRDLLIYLVAFFIYMIGVQAVISFMSIYAADVIKLNSSEIAVMFVIIQVMAAVGSFVFGILEVHYGPKIVISATLVIWFVGVLLCVLAPNISTAFNWDIKIFFICITPLAGMAMGPSQSCSRSLFSVFIPDKLAGEAYGVWELILNLSSAIAMVYGPLADGLGNRWAAMIISVTFIIAIVIIYFIDIEKGRKEKEIWANEIDAGSCLVVCSSKVETGLVDVEDIKPVQTLETV